MKPNTKMTKEEYAKFQSKIEKISPQLRQFRTLLANYRVEFMQDNELDKKERRTLDKMTKKIDKIESKIAVQKKFLEDSGIAKKEGDKLIVKSNIIFYGTEANLAYCSNIICEIEEMWNEPLVCIEYDKKEYQVVFEFTYEVKSIKEVVEAARVNETPENNFVRLESTNRMGRSFMLLNDNSGCWITSDNLGKSTTAPHEVGHGFGLGHTEGNLKGKGQPSIMAARGTKVDSEYQYDPNAKDGESGSTINPTKRKVTKDDVLKIVKDLKFDENGVAEIGNASNRLFSKAGW